MYIPSIYIDKVGMLFDDNEIANKVMTQNIELCLIRKIFN